MLRVSFALLLHLYDLETNRNWRHWLHCQQHALNVDAVAWNLSGEKEISDNIFYAVFSQQRSRADFSLASNIRSPHCNT